MFGFLLSTISIVKNNFVVFSSLIFMTLLQVLSFFVTKTRKFIYYSTSLISVFILFFITFFPYIVGRGGADFISHIANPINGFAIFFLQSVINIWEIFENKIEFTTSKTIEKMDEKIEEAAKETRIEGFSPFTFVTELVFKDVIVKNTDDIKNELQQSSTSAQYEMKKFIKNLLVVFSSFFSYIYLVYMLSADTSMAMLDGLVMFYILLFVGYSYLKYEIMLFIKYYATDDYVNKIDI